MAHRKGAKAKVMHIKGEHFFTGSENTVFALGVNKPKRPRRRSTPYGQDKDVKLHSRDFTIRLA